jgi:hypothetical protein
MPTTTPPSTSPRGLHDYFAAVRAKRHALSAIDANNDIEQNLCEILVEDADATEALKLVAQARDLLGRAREAIERSMAKSKRR